METISNHNSIPTHSFATSHGSRVISIAMGDEQYDLHIKLLMLGDTGVGKTCLLLKYVQNTFSPTFITTIGIDFKIKIIDVEGVKTKLQIWDTAGQERFRTITVSYFKGAHAIMLVYDVTDRDTFDNVNNWISEIRTYADAKVNVLLVGNKCDNESDRKVSYEEGVALAARMGCQFWEVSAKADINVSEAYHAIAVITKNRLLNIQTDPVRPSISIHDAGDDKKRGCCF